MYPYNGQLKQNKIYDGDVRDLLFNMIINQRVFDINVSPNTKLLDMARDEVSGYGDTKLFYYTDVLKSIDFMDGINPASAGAIARNQNVLETHRPTDVKVQSLTIDQVREIAVTVDDNLTKMAFSTEGAYSTLMQVFMSAVEKTKTIHLAGLVNTFVGTNVSNTAISSKTIDVAATDTKEVVGAEIAEGIANILTELADPNRDYTDTAYLRSFNTEDLVVVWNSAYINMIQKRVLPQIYGPDKLTEGLNFKQVVLNSRYFGNVSSATSSVAGARTLKEIEVNGTNYFPGDVLPTGTTVEANSTYTTDPNIICKIMHKDSVKLLTFYNTTESFRNARAKNTNYYANFGYSTLEHLIDFPMLKVVLDVE